MTTLDELNVRLFVAKQELRGFEEAGADARKAAQAPNAEFPSDIYLSLAADLDAQAAAKRQEIADIEAERTKLL
ncbi:hypothetical protein PMN64_12460 [Bradyrhizobium sp. UFLA01-814]|uniref:hypothetical protein n=1 Tax=Bradyrhizobium sp. UFLA01-814 TaxID=3023480 RepID=UPI00398BBBB2